MLVIAFGSGLVLLYLAGWLLMSPMKWLLKGVLWAVLGAAALLVVNWIGAPLGIRIAINPLTAFAAGALGVPGVAMLLVLGGIL